MNGFVGDWSLSNDAVSRVGWLFQAKAFSVSREAIGITTVSVVGCELHEYLDLASFTQRVPYISPATIRRTLISSKAPIAARPSHAFLAHSGVWI